MGISHLAGCTNETLIKEMNSESAIQLVGFAEADYQINIQSEREWNRTEFYVNEGDVLVFHAFGEYICKREKSGIAGGKITQVDPSGTFFIEDTELEQKFPLAAGAKGPAPAYCLIGRIDTSKPFYIGKNRTWKATESGRLYLGVNDNNYADNEGKLHVQISSSITEPPVYTEEAIPLDTIEGKPQADCSVVVFYVDGLRPDVVREMAAMGHLPNIDKLFLKKGVWASNAFTAFPSDTITSNGTMWTGCFSDRHGLKGQVRFNRRTLQSESYLEPLGPNRSSRVLGPQGIDKLIQNSQSVTIKSIKGAEEGERWKNVQTSEIKPLYERLRNQGSDWSTGILPIMTDVPPPLWTRSMMQHLPYLQMQKAWNYVDDANTHFTLLHLLDRRSPVTIVWLPETDSVSHKFSRGQFGVTRRTIALADMHIGRIVEEIKARGEFDSTYFFLVSDHGHHGGRKTHLSHFDIANELFFNSRKVDETGEWIDGGLGLSVRQHRYWNRHQEHNPDEFVFIDGASDGAARIFLPRKHFRSHDWTSEYNPADLLAYKIGDHLKTINLPMSIAATRAVNSQGHTDFPIDLVLMKRTDDSILIFTANRGQALIHRKRDEDGKWLYRYSVLDSVKAVKDGHIVCEMAHHPATDPLKLIGHLPDHMLDDYYNEEEWLRMTTHSSYPDSVVTLTRSLLWQDEIKHREQEYAPDMIVTANPGWFFGTSHSPGTMHGYPLPESMRASFFISGPNIRRGSRLIQPCRLVDLTPTILEMCGYLEHENEFDGHPLRTIYETGLVSATERESVYWNDIDLNAWDDLDYKPLNEFENALFSVNKPESSMDVNNIAYNIFGIGNLNAFRLVDDVLFPFSEKKPVTSFVETIDSKSRRSSNPVIAQTAQALNVPNLVVSDYSFTSLGNLKRIDRSIDWVQQRTKEVDSKMAGLFGKEETPPAHIVHKSIDVTQASFWEVYRFGQRVVVQVLDETILNSLENQTDKSVNYFSKLPEEVQVKRASYISGESEFSF